MSQEKNSMHILSNQHQSFGNHSLHIVADGIHILNPHVHNAIITRNTNDLVSLTRKHIVTGIHALAVNLGPGKIMLQHTPWVVETIRAVTGIPLFFSASIMKSPEVLERYGADITINAVTATREDISVALAAAGKHGCSVVVLLTRSGMLTCGVEDRVRLAVEVIEYAQSLGFPLSRLYIDPILSSRPDPAAWRMSRGAPDVSSAVETLLFIRQLSIQVKTIVALGNISSGMATENRSGTHARILAILAQAGLDAVMLDSLDSCVMDVAAGFQSRELPLASNGDNGTYYSNTGP